MVESSSSLTLYENVLTGLCVVVLNLLVCVMYKFLLNVKRLMFLFLLLLFMML